MFKEIFIVEYPEKCELSEDYIIYMHYYDPFWGTMDGRLNFELSINILYEVKVSGYYYVRSNKTEFNTHITLPKKITEIIETLHLKEKLQINSGLFKGSNIIDDMPYSDYTLNNLNQKNIYINFGVELNTKGLSLNEDEQLFAKLYKLMDKWKKDLITHIQQIN
ncbi:hypothetical protein V1389_08400 [Flavobacterium rakeshii]|uniref:hypothetical protein n=1 Tax=Flavobacterium rakeshii TaxID=1038845 RepID=UPI002E7C09A4|nr:hypothetical protein [Flavobacterium rakeshii]MEE1898352.1 hypothetical protein [Flavobacterium rakeshii]